MIRQFSIILVCFASTNVFAQPAEAQIDTTAGQLPAQVECFRAIHFLPFEFKAHLQPKCIDSVMIACENADDPGACFTEKSAEIREFIEATIPNMPTSIEAGPFTTMRYQRMIERMAERFVPDPECDSLTNIDTEYKYEMCLYFQESYNLVSLVQFLNEAGIWTPPKYETR